MFDRLWALVYRHHATEIALALDHVQTERGAVAIHHAESSGRRRGFVLRAAERRIEQIRGAEDAGRSTSLIASGDAVELPPVRRVVAGVGIGKPHPSRFKTDV